MKIDAIGGRGNRRDDLVQPLRDNTPKLIAFLWPKFNTDDGSICITNAPENRSLLGKPSIQEGYGVLIHDSLDCVNGVATLDLFKLTGPIFLSRILRASDPF
ncbi:hypothetical protein WK52_13880 [Burkholderia multivorans]|nr:hypothetical protein WK52_13880 [Burkholderia multivorans]